MGYYYQHRLTSIQYFLSASHCSSVKEALLLMPFFKWGIWGNRGLSHLPKVHIDGQQSHALSHCPTLSCFPGALMCGDQWACPFQRGGVICQKFTKDIEKCVKELQPLCPFTGTMSFGQFSEIYARKFWEEGWFGWCLVGGLSRQALMLSSGSLAKRTSPFWGHV